MSDTAASAAATPTTPGILAAHRSHRRANRPGWGDNLTKSEQSWPRPAGDACLET
ncbi:MAG: hypothetical protein HHJ09_07870 [Glaciimonas sp.]|nr:hypothetical protein [Glaciimonas sp.]